MPGSGHRYYNCVVCNKRTKPKERKPINESVRKYLKKLFISPSESDIICNTCKHKYYLSESQEIYIPDNACNDSDSDQDYIPPTTKRKVHLTSPPSVSLPIQSASKSHSRCFICKKSGLKLNVVSSDAKFNAFIETGVLIPHGSRCCPVHLNNDGNIFSGCLDNLNTTNQSYVNRSTIVDLLNHMRDFCQRNQNVIDFDNIQDPDCKSLTGLTCEQFLDLFSHVRDKIKATPSRSQKTSLGLSLLKLRSGLSNKLLSTLFRISKSSVRRAFSTVRQALVRGFVPLNLGLESITRENIIQNHTRTLAKKLFNVGDDQMILVLDGTYIYIQKSQNFTFQRRSFSIHKSRPLVKPMIVVTTTGHFVTIVGPYLGDGRNNDASILNHMLRKNIQDIRDYIKENDLLVVDRGFRDSLSFLEELGIKAAMPAFLTKGQSQMATEHANSSRLVTKVRWVVEASNARIKYWKYLNAVLPTNQVPFIGDYIRIVCAISNKYFPALNPTTDCEEDNIVALRMKQLAQQVNSLQDYISEHRLDRRTVVFKRCENIDDLGFPQISEEKLRSITCGVYQIKLCSSYIQEYVDGDSDILIYKDDHNLIRVQIQSRHITAKRYLLWVKFSPTDVVAWYCKCRAGARVVGVCAHVAAIIWYLGSGSKKELCGVKNWCQFVDDAGERIETIDASDSDSTVTEE